MKCIFILFILFYKLLNADLLNLDSSSNKIEVLSSSYIYFDKSKTKSLKEVKKEQFLKNPKETLLFAEKRNFNLWIKVTLKNTGNQKINKILAFDFALLNEIVFYDETKILEKDGAIHRINDEDFIKPTFLIVLEKNEKKTYYFMINSTTSALAVNIKAYVPSAYTQKDLHFQIIMFFFFGAMCILVVYNLFLYFFTKDKLYLYYVLYIFSIILYEYIYLGFAQVYFLPKYISLFLLDSIVAVASLEPIFAILFARKFLNSKMFPILDKILIMYLYLCTLISILTYKSIFLDSSVIILYFPLLLVLIALGVKSYKNNHSLSILYLLGWSAVVSSWFFSMIYNFGIFNIFIYLPYYVEACLLFEASIFSIALAKRINLLKDEKYNLQNKLIKKEKEEKEKLSLKVEERTKELSITLKEKDLLFNELHHRVKNNMQMVVSLMRLQENKNKVEELKPFITIAINRVQTICILHELLYRNNKLGKTNVHEYFSSLISGLKSLFIGEIEIHYKIRSNLNTNDAIYCGLIINELVSNSFKHAFKNKGNVFISLKKVDDYYHLEVKDDGKGYKEKDEKNLGLLIISTLVREQLKGKLSINTAFGTSTKIVWRDSE